MNPRIGKIFRRKRLKLPYQPKFRKPYIARWRNLSLFSIFYILHFATYAQPLQTVVQQGHELSVLSVVVNSDSNFAISTSKDKSAKLWELSTGREVRSYLGHTASVTCASLSSDGKYLLTGSNDKHIKLWEVQTGKELYSLSTEDYITDVAIDPKGRFFVRSGYNDSGYGDSVFIYQFDSKKILSRLAANPDKGLGSGVKVSISPDGKWLAFGEDNHGVKVVDTDSWTIVYSYNIESGFCGGCGTFVLFSPDSKKLYFASPRGKLRRLDLSNFKISKEFPEEVSEITGLTVSPDSRKVALSSEKELRVYDDEKAVVERRLIAKEKENFHRIAFTLDSKELLISCGNTVKRWSSSENAELTPLSGFLTQRDKGGLDYDPDFYWESHIAKYVRLKNPIAILPGGKTLLKGKFGSLVKQLDIATGKTTMEYSSHKKAVLALDISKDGKRLVTGGGDGKIVVWDVASGDSIRAIRSYHEPIFDIHFSNDDSMVLSSSWDGSMRLHDIQTGKVQSHIAFESGSAYAVAFHPGDLYVATARLDNSLQLWELDTKTAVRNFVGHTGIVSSLTFLKDQKHLASGAWDGTVRIWNVASGLMIRKIVHSSTPVHAILQTSDGSHLISAGADRLIKVWDVSTGTLVRSFEGHQAEVTTLVLSSDDKMLISHSVDGVTKFWNMESGQEFFEHFQLGPNDWLVKNREGYFNGTDNARKYIHFVKGMKTYNVDQFFDDFYRPDLLPKIFQSRGLTNQSNTIDHKIRKSPPPLVKVALIPLSAGKAQVMVRMFNEGGGVGMLKLFHNGKSIAVQEKHLHFPDKSGDFTTYSHEVDLIGGNNIFTAIAANKENIESDPKSVEIFAESEIKHSICHILSVGINEYKNPKLNLNYAKPDASSFSKVMDEQSSVLFKEIRSYNLFDSEASRQNILAKLDELSNAINPEDVFIFYYAGHGSMVDNNFYFIPTENLRLYDHHGLQKDAIEAGAIQEKLRKIKALKQLIVMDACQSGGSVELLAARGVNEEKAIAQLSRSTGIHVLASAGSEQFAAEFAELGHGLFTYVLLKGLEGDADGSPKDGKVTIYELKSYIDDQVPELTRRMKGRPQYPYTFSRGQDFPVVMKRKGE